MEAVRFLVGAILPYLALLVFVFGMVYRIRTWLKLPAPAMTLTPAPPTEGDNKSNVLMETFFFRSLFKGDRGLWLLAWVLHVVLALIFVGHLRVFTNIDALFMGLGMSEQAIQGMSSGAGGAAGIIILITLGVLILRHVAIPRVREITGFADYAALLLIVAIIITGNSMRFGAEHFNLALTHEYFKSLATFGNIMGSPALRNSTFLVHMLLALLLVMFMPFSKILHFGGIFFTHQMIRKH